MSDPKSEIERQGGAAVGPFASEKDLRRGGRQGRRSPAPSLKALRLPRARKEVRRRFARAATARRRPGEPVCRAFVRFRAAALAVAGMIGSWARDRLLLKV
jgi:hypothetical protein